MNKKIIIGLAVIAFTAIGLKKRQPQNTNNTFYLAKDTPYYDAVRGMKLGTLQAVVDGVQQCVTVTHFANEKWAVLTGNRYVKLSYLQVNIDGVQELMAKEDVLIFSAPQQHASRVGVLSFGTRVTVIENAGEWTKICVQKGCRQRQGYVVTAYMKY
ncbi:SH3 domain-containing protein [Kurthia huakuii]|uniref:SH3 domain-containing protein n=1 Tax=Kurthia huakuii TaxID=1421019 RepID=UPI000496531D|nr:SH3 domain-containing protein [Kurthia huakuii]MBM7700369.1 hypothetical protein [Kurthia huakuii]